MSDNTIISKIGAYIRENRLSRNITQAQLAHDAGINRWTISQIENGESVTLNSLIQILRALDLLHILDIFTIEDKISPIEYAKLKSKKRKRARPSINEIDSEQEPEW